MIEAELRAQVLEAFEALRQRRHGRVRLIEYGRSHSDADPPDVFETETAIDDLFDLDAGVASSQYEISRRFAGERVGLSAEARILNHGQDLFVRSRSENESAFYASDDFRGFTGGRWVGDTSGWTNHRALLTERMNGSKLREAAQDLGCRLQELERSDDRLRVAMHKRISMGLTEELGVSATWSAEIEIVGGLLVSSRLEQVWDPDARSSETFHYEPFDDKPTVTRPPDPECDYLTPVQAAIIEMTRSPWLGLIVLRSGARRRVAEFRDFNHERRELIPVLQPGDQVRVWGRSWDDDYMAKRTIECRTALEEQGDLSPTWEPFLLLAAFDPDGEQIFDQVHAADRLDAAGWATAEAEARRSFLDVRDEPATVEAIYPVEVSCSIALECPSLGRVFVLVMPLPEAEAGGLTVGAECLLFLRPSYGAAGIDRVECGDRTVFPGKGVLSANRVLD